MNIGIIGSGIVAQTLAAGFIQHGYNTMLGTRDPEKLSAWQEANPLALINSVAETAEFGEVLVLAVKGTAAHEALQAATAEDLAGKVILDATNPIADAPPTNGVLTFFTEQNSSLMEQLQQAFPEARFVKAFSSVGAACMVNPDFPDGRPTMFICGNDAAAKQTTTMILEQFGWKTEDMGHVEAARAIEPLCMLWCIPGFLRGEWTHAFKLLK